MSTIEIRQQRGVEKAAELPYRERERRQQSPTDEEEKGGKRN